MLFEEKVVNFLRPLRGTSGKAERQLFNHKRQMSMISNSDFEKLWVLYKTEGEPQGVSINAFCISRGVNYNEFFDERSGKAERNKWFRKMHKSVVPLEVEGAPDSESKVTIEPMEDEPKTRKGGIQVFIRTNDGLKVQKNGLGYQGLVKLVSS